MTLPRDRNDEGQHAARALAEAYLRTTYRVWIPGAELELRVGKADAGLAGLLRGNRAGTAALLTAWNPGSERHTRQWNESAQRRLLAELSRSGHRLLRARNEPDAAQGGADWTEESVLALDLELPPARALASRYGQAAFLWIDASATPQLIFTAAGV